MKKSTPNSEYNLEQTVEGMQVELTRALLHRKSITVLVPEPQLDMIKKEDIIVVEDPKEGDIPEQKFPDAPVKGDDEDDAAFATKMTSWEQAKTNWEKAQAEKPPLKRVTMWQPIYHVTQAKVDGHNLKVFHTVRGPIVGLVMGESTQTVTLYSPAYLDPNIQQGRVHFLPLAFAGYQITLHKPCFGESVPDQPICLAYPRYVKQNQQGDYIMRGKGAYHHVEADIDQDAPTVSVEPGVRAKLAGALPTSDGRQAKEIAQAKAMQALQAQQRQQQQNA